MDEIKAGMARKHRVGSAPCLEPLEGRRLMTAAPSQVGIKEVPDQTFTQLSITGTNKGDVLTINDSGSLTPGNVTVTLGNGTTYTSKGAISVIEFQGGSGADKVTYNLTGPLTSPQSVLFNLGAGNDQFTANVAGAINDPNGLDLEAFGGAGNDKIVVNQTGPTLTGLFVPYLEGDAGNDTLIYNGTGSIEAGASVTPEFSGGAGNDTIKTNYSGQIIGNFIYNLSANGGAGGDTIIDNINVAAGSTGTVGTSASSPAVVEGGPGNDHIHFAINVDPNSTATVNAVAIGGAGKDVVEHTSTVGSDPSNEKNTIVAS